MPFAPVSMSTPTVSWPLNPATPASTELQLTAQQPLSVTARFSCAAVAAAQKADGLLLATTRAGRPSETEGLFIRLDGNDLAVTSDGADLYRGVVPSGGCAYEVSLTGSSTRITRDGRPLVEDATAHLPQVDVLQTSLTSLPGATAADFGVDVRVDDQFSTSPTPIKWALTAILVLSSGACLLLLFRRERARRRVLAPLDVVAPRRRLRWLRHVTVVDVAVVLLLLAWLFIAPMTDDDGYYAAMARNSVADGYVGNYYQLFNQGYTPFTWFYQLLGYWALLGHSPVMLRIPSLVAGLLTYVLVRVVVESVGLPPARNARARFVRSFVVGLVFAAAWLPYCLGVRPESVVALLAVMSLGAVIVARKRGSLGWFSLSLVISGIAFTCHPTGVVAFAPWFASIPVMWPLVRSSALWRTGARIVGVVAPAAIAAVPGFLDGSLNDFTRSGQIFQQWPNNQWYDEQLRYSFLLSDGAMGAYAKRAVILVGIVVLVWFVALQLVAAGRRTRSWPPLMALTGYSYGLALLLLWLTPSKWTHHFGSIAGLGAIFIGGCLIHCGRMVVAVQRGRRSLAPVTVLAGISLVLAFALALHGPNTWAYSWMISVPQAFQRPHVGAVSLDSPAFWLVVVVAVALVVTVRLRRSRRTVGRIAGTAAPVAIVIFLLGTVVYLVGGFAYATVASASTYSPWSDALRDPLGHNCGAEGAITAPDPATAQALPRVPGGTSGSTGFSPTGYLPSSPPPQGADGPIQVWGSYPRLGGEDNTGRLTTDWYQLPSRDGGDRLLVDGSGKFGGGNDLVAEYGQRRGSDVVPVGRQSLDDHIDSPDWRQVGLDVPADAGADAVRLVATDATGGPGGWLAVTAPFAAQPRLLAEQIPASDTVGVSWQFSFLFPCANQPETVDGITQPSSYLIAWGDTGLRGLDDNIYSRARGGLFHPTIRSSSLVKLDAAMVGHPEVKLLQVYAVTNPYPADGYDLATGRTTRWGWQGP